MKQPAECENMQDVRAGIDALDSQILQMMARRVGYVDRAAVIKQGNGLPADIPSRVEEVVTKVRAKARAEGVPEEMIEQMWRIMIRTMIAREEVVLGKDPK